MNKYYIPQNLDAPFKIAIFTVFDLIVILVPFFVIAFGFQKQVLALIVSAGLFLILKRIKGEEDNHFFKHFFYWHFPSVGLYKVTPPSHVREIIG
ncbi:MAG: type IV conjugative transfer system protein TraL [Gammaproteobacteria bacterium]